MDSLVKLAQQAWASLASGGPSHDTATSQPPRNTIPAIRQPIFISKEHAQTEIEPDDWVIIYHRGTKDQVFPVKILDKHEIVHLPENGQYQSITFCPLTGTAIGYPGRWLVSGKLYRNNLVMYEWNSLAASHNRPTDQTWLVPQILGLAINPSQQGQIMARFDLELINWQDYLTSLPAAKLVEVLAQSSGQTIRPGINYNLRSYQQNNLAYRDNQEFLGVRPLVHQNRSLAGKTLVKLIQIPLQNIYVVVTLQSFQIYGRSEEMRFSSFMLTLQPNKPLATTRQNQIDLIYRDLRMIYQETDSQLKIEKDPAQTSSIDQQRGINLVTAYFFAVIDLYGDNLIILNWPLPPFDSYVVAENLVNYSSPVQQFFSQGQGFKPEKFISFYRGKQQTGDLVAPKTQYLKRMILLIFLGLSRRNKETEFYQRILKPFASVGGGMELSWPTLQTVVGQNLDLFNQPELINQVINQLDAWIKAQ